MTNDYQLELEELPWPRKGDWMQTATGKAFYPNDPRPDDFDIEDIAHALSNICRFGGHCTTFYSVAQHSVLVSRAAGALALEGLMHDAAEAYLGDMIRPLKHDGSPLGEAFRRVELKVEKALVLQFGLTYTLWPEQAGWPADVKHADNVLLATEMRDVMVEPPQPWNTLPPPLDIRIRPLTPADAKALFLKTYMELVKLRGQETRTRPA